jgi:hypothetical protein
MEHNTSWPESLKHPLQRRQASTMEVEKTSSCRRRIVVALLPTAWMSTTSWDLPSLKSPQSRVSTPPPTAPPWLDRG